MEGKGCVDSTVVDHRLCNPKVLGSIPGEYPERIFFGFSATSLNASLVKEIGNSGNS